LEVASALIHAGADVNTRHSNGKERQGGLTALMIAAARGQNDIVQLLVENGADVSVTSEDGLDALCYAALDRHDGTRRWNIWKAGLPKKPDTIRILQKAGGQPAEAACYIDPDYLTRAPKRIAILPIDDHRSLEEVDNAKSTPEKLAEGVAKELKSRRYDVISAVDVAAKVSSSGSAAERLDAAVCSATGADGLLAIAVLGSAKTNIVVARASAVALKIVLTRCDTGQVLMKHSAASFSEHRGFLIAPFISGERMIASLLVTYMPFYPNPGDEKRDYSK
jgi:hypothetical protein